MLNPSTLTFADIGGSGISATVTSNTAADGPGQFANVLAERRRRHGASRVRWFGLPLRQWVAG